MGPILCFSLRFFSSHFRIECNTNSSSPVHISINDQLRFFNSFYFSTNFVFVFVLLSFYVLRSIFLVENEMKRNENEIYNNFRRKIAYCVLSSINPDGFTQCPTTSTDISTGTDATNNNGTATTQYTNDIANGNHQESCLWPNALQVILKHCFNCFIFSFIFCSLQFLYVVCLVLLYPLSPLNC